MELWSQEEKIVVVFLLLITKKKESLQLLTHRSCFTHLSTVGGGNVPARLKRQRRMSVQINQSG